MKDQIVRDLRTLRGMEKKGHITFHEDTGKILYPYGHKWKCVYIGGYQKWNFEYKGKKYSIEYFSGCFCPFVVEV